MKAIYLEQKTHEGELIIGQLNENSSYNISKRLIDFLFSFFGILLFLPLFLLISILIKLEDPRGPVLFKQVRVGKNGEEFYMYKFRSMVTDAEKQLENLLKFNEVDGLMFKMKDDPRVTKIGKFLRKTSLDEFPQLFNVLKGQMSLVGPRPALPREVKDYSRYHKQRLLVVPGCTGLWQVTARNTVGFEEMVNLDIEYIQRRTIFYDLKIVFKTFNVLLSKTGY